MQPTSQVDQSCIYGRLTETVSMKFPSRTHGESQGINSNRQSLKYSVWLLYKGRIDPERVLQVRALCGFEKVSSYSLDWMNSTRAPTVSTF